MQTSCSDRNGEAEAPASTEPPPAEALNCSIFRSEGVGFRAQAVLDCLQVLPALVLPVLDHRC